MAIDMIESNDLGALAPSRLGMYQFADEAFRNYTGDSEFFNAKGRRAKIEKYKGWAQEKFAGLPTDCENIQNSINIINEELKLLLKSKSSLNTKTQIAETNQVLARFKKLQISQDCDRVLTEKKTAEERAEALKTLGELSDTSVEKAQRELKGLQGGGKDDNTKKILIYGGVGLAVLVAVVLILRK